MKKTIKSFVALMLLAGVLPSYGQAGIIDSTFGINGKVMHQIDSAFGNDIMALQQSGKIIVPLNKTHNGHPVFCMARFNADGSIDANFGINGQIIIPVGTVNDRINCIAIQPDDKIVVGGATYINTVPFWAVVRCNADGTIDSSFADNGIKTLDMNSPSNILVRPDGKIITTTVDGPNYLTVLTRLNADGSLDTGFGNLGSVTAPDNGHFTGLTVMKLQPDNKIIGINAFDTTDHPLAIVRFNENGAPDSAFGTNGYVVTNLKFGASNSGLLLQPDNKIVVSSTLISGANHSKSVILRLNSNGTNDNSFGIGGRVEFGLANNLQNYSMAVALQSDNKIVIAGPVFEAQGSWSSKKDFMLARFRTNGVLDTEFGNNGYTVTNFDSANNDYPLALFIVDGGKLLAGGVSIPPGPQLSSIVFARYNSCGISITGQPVNQTKALGSTANFNVTSTSPSAGYQWQTDGAAGWEDLGDAGQYSGTQTHSLHIANVTLANDQQRFRTIALSGACTDTSGAAILTVDSTTGIAGIDRPNSFRIYPNPVSDLLHISSADPKDRIQSIKIINMLGRIVDVIPVNGKSRTTISCRGWATGTYMIQVVSEDGKTGSFHVAKK